MRNIIITVYLLSFAIACKDNNYPQSFPIVFTSDVSNISSEGAQFAGSIESLGSNQIIIGYGFVWSEFEMPSISSAKVTLSHVAQGAFSKTITYDLMNGGTYYVRAFIQTPSKVIYGNQVSFVSKGSLPPTISGFTPGAAEGGSLITIQGKNFSPALDGNLAKIGSLICPVVSATDTLLKITLPVSEFFGDSKISITVAGVTVVSENLFTTLGPVINTVSKLSGRVGDLITLGGENFDVRFTLLNVIYNSTYSYGISGPTYVMSPTQAEYYVPDFQAGTGKFGLFATFNTTYGVNFLYPSSEFTIINSWSKIGNGTDLGGTTGISSVNINETIYFVGGSSTNAFNTLTNTWSKRADFPGGYRYSGTAFIYNGNLYYGFGEGHYAPQGDANGIYYNDLWMYDPSRDTWTFVMNSPMSSRAWLNSFTINSQIYFGFGLAQVQNTRVSYSDLWQFDPSALTWTQLTTPLTNNSGNMAASFAVGNKGYFVGLENYGTSWPYTADVWQFDPTAKTWTQMPDFPDRVYGDPGLASSDKGYVFSGDSGGQTKHIYEFDPVKLRWITKQSFPGYQISGEFATYVGGAIYYGTGLIYPSPLTPDFWKLDLN